MINLFVTFVVQEALRLHFLIIKNSTEEPLVERMSDLPPLEELSYTLNCNPVNADKDFLAQVQKSDKSVQEAFEKYLSNIKMAYVMHVARIEIENTVLQFTPCGLGDINLRIAQREDFDLKSNTSNRAE